MIKIRSIRWRLTLSYAAIACLAALALGIVLLGILRGYYDGQERAYLDNNAASFQTLISSAIAEDVPITTLQPQLENLAFFSKVRIRVLDEQGQELVDTGIPNDPKIISFFYKESAPNSLQVQTMKLDPLSELIGMEGNVQVTRPAAVAWQVGVQTDTADPSCEFVPFSKTIRETSPGQVASGGELVVSERPAGDVMVSAVSALPLSSTFYGFSVGGSDEGITNAQDTSRHSDQQIRSIIFDANHSEMLTLVLSDGPAYGSEIVSSVARGWLFAGGIAIVLAAAAGLLVSREISKPLLELTEVTTHMTAGDLSTRAAIERQDELGILAQSFNTMADRIQEIVVTLQRFVADAAHELHTPLTALRTNLELANNEFPSTAIRRAHEQVIRLEKLTDGLLALSRVEAQSGSEHLAPVDLGHLIRATSELYASRAEQAGLGYELSLPEEVPPVMGRANQLECVITNLMDNAIKFTPPEGKVSLSLRYLDQRLELTVQDTGIGIPADDLPNLFERFRRGHNASDHPGSGLGLAITKAIVKAHGGSISAESDSAGTRITVHLPIVATES
jgi:signal transduction histidine kinase